MKSSHTQCDTCILNTHVISACLKLLSGVHFHCRHCWCQGGYSFARGCCGRFVARAQRKDSSFCSMIFWSVCVCVCVCVCVHACVCTRACVCVLGTLLLLSHITCGRPCMEVSYILHPQVYGSVVASRYSNQHVLPLAHMTVSRWCSTCVFSTCIYTVHVCIVVT